MVGKKMESSDLSEEEKEEVGIQVAIAAIKISILKQGIGRDIVFDPEQSLSFEGDSGPYVQYAAVRGKSVLAKSKNQELGITNQVAEDIDITSEELAVLRWLYRFPEAVEAAARNYSPNLVVEYVLELAKRFNGFYNKHKIVGSEKEGFRLELTKAVVQVLESGLCVLGVGVPNKM